MRFRNPRIDFPKVNRDAPAEWTGRPWAAVLAAFRESSAARAVWTTEQGVRAKEALLLGWRGYASQYERKSGNSGRSSKALAGCPRGLVVAGHNIEIRSQRTNPPNTRAIAHLCDGVPPGREWRLKRAPYRHNRKAVR